MKEIQLSRPGKFNSIKLVDSSLGPDLAPGHVQVKVHYSGLNFADIMMRLGLYPDAPPAPFCPGYEISGEIEKVGPGVQGLEVGQKVMAGCHFGGLASVVVLPEWQVRAIGHLDLASAAALPVSGLTCDLALGKLARVSSQDSVMIDCGTGALGAIMIAYLKNRGVQNIIGLTSQQSKLDILKERGVKGMLISEWQSSAEMVDIIINSRGGKTLAEDQKHLKPLGRLVALGASHMISKGGLSYLNVLTQFFAMKKQSFIELMHANQGIMGLNVLRLFSSPEVLKDSLETVSNLAQDGVLTPAIDSVYHASEVEQAYDHLGQRKSHGKVLIKWGDHVL